MGVVSTSNLVSSEAEKTTTIYNFQTMNIIILLCHMTWWEVKMKIYKYKAIPSFMMAEMSKSSLRNTYKQNSKIKIYQQ